MVTTYLQHEVWHRSSPVSFFKWTLHKIQTMYGFFFCGLSKIVQHTLPYKFNKLILWSLRLAEPIIPFTGSSSCYWSLQSKLSKFTYHSLLPSCVSSSASELSLPSFLSILIRPMSPCGVSLHKDSFSSSSSSPLASEYAYLEWKLSVC